jgi:hypothetical protein
VLPSPLLLVAPATGRVLFANRAAHAALGGAFPLDAPAPEAARVAAGERFSNLRTDWETPAGTRTLVVSGDTIVPPGRAPLGVITF